MKMLLSIKNAYKSSYWIYLLGILCLCVYLKWGATAAFQATYAVAYRVLRGVFEYTFGLLPFPAIVLWLACVVYFLLKNIIKNIKSKNIPIYRRGLDFLFFLGRLAFILVLIFYCFWGFNYKKNSFIAHINLKKVNFDTTALKKEMQAAMQDMVAAYAPPPTEPLDVEAEVNTHVTQIMAEHGFKTGFFVRLRFLRPKGLLLRWGISGIYMPFSGESHIDGGLHALEWPFTGAHEVAHAHGWTDEGVCNFIAYLACRQSSEAWVRYSACLNYFKYVASAYRRFDPEAYAALYKTLPPAVQADLKAIRDNHALYPNWWDTSRVNDAYLKWNGVKQGVQSYSDIVTWVHAWRS